MKSLRWVTFILAIFIGLAAGLIYGWVINPVRYVDATLADLHEDFKTDYVWMVAEAFQAEKNSTLATERLSPLGVPSAQAVHDALLSAMQSKSKFRDSDLEKIRKLEQALRDAGIASPTPSPSPSAEVTP